MFCSNKTLNAINKFVCAVLQTLEKAIRLNAEKQVVQRASETEEKSTAIKTAKTTKGSKTAA